MDVKIKGTELVPLPIRGKEELKNYILCMFTCSNRDIRIDTVYLVDRLSHKVYAYRTGYNAIDETKSLIEMYGKRTIGDYLVDVMLGRDIHLGSLLFLFNTDSASEMLKVVQDIRINQAEFALQIAKKHSLQKVENPETQFLFF